MQHLTDCRVDPVAPHVHPDRLRGTECVDLGVAGVGCPNCANRIRNALLTREGIVEVEIDVQAGVARVWSKPLEVSLQDVLDTVAAAGEGTHHEYLAVPLRSDL